MILIRRINVHSNVDNISKKGPILRILWRKTASIDDSFLTPHNVENIAQTTVDIHAGKNIENRRPVEFFNSPPTKQVTGFAVPRRRLCAAWAA